MSLIIAGNSRPVASGFAFPPTGVAPLTVALQGTGADQDGSIDEYAWDFDGDGFYDWIKFGVANGDTSHEYADAGVYNAKFRVTDDKGAWDTDTVTVIVNEATSNLPPTAALESSAHWGLAPCDVTFDAGGSDDPDGWIVDHQWDFDGDGITDQSTGSVAQVVHHYNEDGAYTCRIRVVDNKGADDVAQVDFTAGVWDTTTLYTPPDWGSYSALEIVGGSPAAAFVSGDPSQTYFVRANDALGESWGSVVPVTTQVSGIDLGIVNANPAVVLGGGPYYSRSTDAVGGSWPAVIDVDPGVTAGTYVSMAEVDNNPAICYQSDQENGDGDLFFIRATDTNGTAWGSHVLLYGDGAGPEKVGRYSSLLVVDEYPAVACNTSDVGVIYMRATDASGSSWGAPVGVASGQNIKWVSMQLLLGKPAIVFFDGTNNIIWLVKALDAQGSTWDTPLIVDRAQVAQGVSFSVADGRPTIIYNMSLEPTATDLCAHWADDAQGTTWGPRRYLATGNTGSFPSLLALDGDRTGLIYHDPWDGGPYRYAVLVAP